MNSLRGRPLFVIMSNRVDKYELSPTRTDGESIGLERASGSPRSPGHVISRHGPQSWPGHESPQRVTTLEFYAIVQRGIWSA